MSKDKIFKGLCCIFSLAIFVGCHDRMQEDRGIEIVGYDNPIKRWGEDMSWSDFYCIKLESPGDNFFTSIQRIDFCDSTLLVQDLEGLYAYDLQGKFLHKYGEKGHGRNEYLHLSAFIVNPFDNLIQIIDSYSGKVLSYTIEGLFVDAIEYPEDFTKDVYRATYIAKDKIFSNYFLNRHGNVAFRLYDGAQNRVCDVAAFHMGTDGAKERFGLHPYAAGGESGTIFVEPFDNIIYRYAGESSSPAYQVATSKKIYTKKEMEKMNYTSAINQNYGENDHVFLGFSDIFESSTHLLLNTFLNSFFLVDKTSMIGQRYCDYTLEKDSLMSVPLMNVCAMKDDYLVGIQTFSELKTMEFANSEEQYVRKLRNTLNGIEDSDDDQYLLLFYRL